jgi:hypothetical protein
MIKDLSHKKVNIMENRHRYPQSIRGRFGGDSHYSAVSNNQ